MVLEKKFANTGFSIKPELIDPLTAQWIRQAGGSNMSYKSKKQQIFCGWLFETLPVLKSF